MHYPRFVRRVTLPAMIAATLWGAVLTAGAAANPCAPKAQNPCAPGNPCGGAASQADRIKAQSYKDLNDVPTTSLQKLTPGQFDAVAGRAMNEGVLLMGGTPVTGKVATLQGEVIDLTCYTGAGLAGRQHTLCARVCAMKGGPIGLLTSKGKVYTIVPAKAGMPPADDVLDALGRNVQVTGVVNDRGSLATIAIQSLQRR